MPLFPPQTTVETLQQFLRDHPKISLVGVQEKDGLLGVIQTDKFSATLATRYSVSLYSDRPITHLMDKKPLMVNDIFEHMTELKKMKNYRKLIIFIVKLFKRELQI